MFFLISNKIRVNNSLSKSSITKRKKEAFYLLFLRFIDTAVLQVFLQFFLI